MPEEVNRMVTDSITNCFFTTSEYANRNLRQAGIPEERIHFVGHTMDTLLANLPRITKPDIFDELGLKAGAHLVTTLHRPVSVDKDDAFAQLLTVSGNHIRVLPAIFPVHPRTAKTLRQLTDTPGDLHLVDPQPYLEFNCLARTPRQ